MLLRERELGGGRSLLILRGRRERGSCPATCGVRLVFPACLYDLGELTLTLKIALPGLDTAEPK